MYQYLREARKYRLHTRIQCKCDACSQHPTRSHGSKDATPAHCSAKLPECSSKNRAHSWELWGMWHTAGGKKKKKRAFTEKQEKEEILLKLQKRDDVNSRLHRETISQKCGEKNKTVNKAVLKTPTCPSYRQNLKRWRRPAVRPAGFRSNAIWVFNFLPKMRFYKATGEHERRAGIIFFSLSQCESKECLMVTWRAERGSTLKLIW